MLDEYALPGLCPDGQVMELARPLLGPEVLNSATVQGCRDGDVARVASRVVRHQRPLAKAVFLTLEDEWGLSPSPSGKAAGSGSNTPCGGPLVVIEARSCRDHTLTAMGERAWPQSVPLDDRQSRRWR